MSAVGRLPRLLAIAVIAALGVLGVGAARAWRNLETTRAQHAELAERIQREEREVTMLAARIERLRHDPRTLETTARQELGWVKERELLVVFEEEPPVPAVMVAEPPAP